MKKSTRYLSMLLVLLMVLSVVPAMSFASVAESSKLTIESAVRGDYGSTTTVPIDGQTGDYLDMGNGWDLGGGVVNPNCYVELKLTEECKIDAINVVNYQGSRYYHWQAYVTDDNTKDISEWTAVGGKTTDESSTAEGYTHTFAEPVVGTYVRVYGTFHSANGGYHFNEITLYGETVALNRNKITIGAYGTGVENWKSSEASYGYATQLLLTIGESTIYDEDDKPVTVTGANIVPGLKNGTLKTQLVIGGKTYDIAPSTYYDTWLLRFETCLAETPFIPEKGNVYEVTLNILSAEDDSLVYTGKTNVSCDVDPVFLYDCVEFDAPVESLDYYYEGNETHPIHKTAIMLPNGVPTGFFKGEYKYEFVVNGSAVYTDIPFYAHYSWGSTQMAGMKFLEGGWFPEANKEYDLTIKIYAPSYPSGNYRLVQSYEMNKKLLLEKEEVTSALLYSYDITAENGTAYVSVEEVTSRETVSCPKGDSVVEVAVPIIKYNATAIPSVPGAKFLGWFIGDTCYSTDATFVFTAEKGDNLDIVAKFEKAEDAEPVGDVKFEGYQVSQDGHDIRFVGSVDNLNYESVDLQIFALCANGKVYNFPTTKVFKTLTGNVNGSIVNVATTADSGVSATYTVDADYLFGLAVADIPDGDYTFMIVPTATTKDGKTVYGEVSYIRVSIKNPEITEMTFTESHPRNPGQSTAVYNDGDTYFNNYKQMQFPGNGEHVYLTVDLGKLCYVTELNIYMYSRDYDFEVYGSADGETWTLIGSNADQKPSYTQETGFVFSANDEYQYIKLDCTNGAYGFFSLVEFDAFGYAVE